MVAVSVHVAPHPDVLVARLCDTLAIPPEDPFAPELIAVPTRGIERWLTQQIASGLADRGIGDGIAANIDFPSPRQLVRGVLLAVPELAASVEAWQTDQLVSHVLAAIDAHSHAPWLRLIDRYIEADPANRLAAATKIARLFATYARRRPEMIRAWAIGADTGPGGEPIAAGDVWQPGLWRLVRGQIGVLSLAELLPAGLEPIRTGAVDLDLPDRLAVYGLTATDPLDLQVLHALGEQRDVTLHVLHPSPALWESGGAAPVHHPLLDSWGKDSRELQLVLSDTGLTAAAAPSEAAPTTLLAHLQYDIEANRPPTTLDNTDRSVQIHVTHGARRQVEVLRDAILHILEDDPTLEPRDIVIMTPDLATFAPLLEAAFPANGDTDGLPDLRLRIADRSPAAVNPLVRFADTVLELADSRLEANTVRELVTRPVVQQRFGFDLDTAAAITKIIDDSHISWGVDAEHRNQWGAGDVAARTWSRGLDRALTGVFYSDDPVRVIEDTVPLDGVEGQDAIPVGLLAAIIDRITAIRDTLGGPLPMSQWGRAISHGVRLLARPAWDDEWQLGQLERLLAETFPETDGPDPMLSLSEARTAIAAWTETRPSPLHFRTGDVTVCTLVPMRSVPYRVVCLLGMDDTRFPRSSRDDGDDLLLGDERVGDFDRSSEDRQLLLDALMAAGDHLVVTYAGRDQLTNAALPPAVPIAELYDTLREMIGADGVAAIETVHPLQSFSEANFTPGALDLPGSFGFDPVALAGARALTAPPALPPTLAWPPPEPAATIDLDDLIRFLQHPTQRFLQTRIGMSIPDPGEIPDDTLPADLDALAAWGVKERLLDGLAAGYDLDRLTRRAVADDALPPGALGTDDLDGAVEAATALWEAATGRGYDRQQMRPYRGSVTVGDMVIEGAVSADPGRAHLFTVTASKVKGKHRLRSFAELVFLSALEPDTAWQAHLLGRRTSGTGHVAVTLGPIKGDPADRRDKAVELLGELIALYREGWEHPLPVPCETGFTWQRNIGSGWGRARYRAGQHWDGTFGENKDSANVLLLRAGSIDDLLDAGLEDYCTRLWAPIFGLMGEKQL